MNRFSSFRLVSFCVLFLLTAITGCAASPATEPGQQHPVALATDTFTPIVPPTGLFTPTSTFTPIAPPTPTSAALPPIDQLLPGVELTPAQGFFIINSLSAKCLDVKGFSGTETETPLQLWDCEFSDPQTDQKWGFTTEGFLVNLSSRKCLDVKGLPGVNNEDPLQLGDCEYSNADTDQMWNLE